MTGRRLLARLRRLEPTPTTSKTWIITVIQMNERREITTHPIGKVVWKSSRKD